VDVDEKTGYERALIIGEPTKEGMDIMSMQNINF